MLFVYREGTGKAGWRRTSWKEFLNPSDALFRPGTESRPMRCIHRASPDRLSGLPGQNWKGLAEYRFIDSATRAAILHLPTNTRLRVIGSNGKTAFGLVGCPWVDMPTNPAHGKPSAASYSLTRLRPPRANPTRLCGVPVHRNHLSPAMGGLVACDLALGKSGQGPR